MKTFACSVLACALAALSFAVTVRGASKVDETVVGPVGIKGHYVMSERGAHIAFAGVKDGKSAVIVDGVSGREFDQLLRPTGENLVDTNRTVIGRAAQTTTGQYNEGPVLMSVDGEHHAYLARQANDVVVIHDGKEVGRAPKERFYFQNNPLRITPNGRQVCWTEVDPSQTELRTRVVVSGKPGPWTAGAGSSGVVFSGDESRHAYRYTTTDKKHALAVDGKDAGYLGSNPTFTADGKLLITSGMEGKEAVILVDGKAVAKGARAGRIVPASTGRRWGALLYRKDAQFNDVSVLIIDGKEVSDGAETRNIWFSPDGKRYAAASHHHFNRGPDYMIVDGKRGAEFPNVTHETEPFWSPDSSTLIYTAKSATGSEIVVVANGKETSFPGRLIDDSLVFSERGGHYAFSKTDPRLQNQIAHIVDGKEVGQGPAIVAGSFVFSTDGSRHGYLVNQQGLTATLVLNGQAVPDFSAGFLATWSVSAKGQRFSLGPDGKSVAAYARNANNTVVGLWLDGKVVHPTTSAISYPGFTPDGKHLCWTAQGGTGLVVYVDGKPTARADGEFFGARPEIWSMDKSGVITFLGAVGDVVKRFRITPASDTSLATLLANGTQGAEPAAPPPASVAASQPTPTPTAVKSAALPPAEKPTPVATGAAKPATPVPTVSTPPSASAVVSSAPATTKPATPQAAPAAAPVVPLTWNDLVRRPETRPATCTVNKEYRFQGGIVVRPGTAVNLIEVKPASVLVSTQDGRANFEAKSEETDLLVLANAAWAQLLPVQRDLTYATLFRRTDLWPYRLKLLVAYTLEGAKTRVGDNALLIGLEGDQLLIVHETTKMIFNVKPSETDLMAKARVHLASEAGAPGRVIEELVGKVQSPLTGQPVALDTTARPKLVVMYRGAGWCGPCLAFSPELVKALKAKAPKSSDVTMIFVSADNSPAEAKAYATKIGIDWPTLYYKSRDQLPAFNAFFGDAIPQLIVTDRHGKILIDSNRIGTAQALQQLQKLL